MGEDTSQVITLAARKYAIMIALLVCGGWLIGWTTALLVIGIARL